MILKLFFVFGILPFCLCEKIEVSTTLTCCVPISKDNGENEKNCKPLEGALIELWEEDGVIPGDSNDFLERKTFSGKDGKFSIDGEHSEWGDEHFLLKIYTNCGFNNCTNKHCRETIFKIPPLYIGKTYDHIIIINKDLGSDIEECSNAEKCQTRSVK